MSRVIDSLRGSHQHPGDAMAGGNACIDHFTFHDRYANHHGDKIEARVERLATMGFHGDAEVDPTCRRSAAMDHSNPPTAWLIAQVPTMAAWLSLLPSAAALEPLYRPDLPALPNGTRIDSLSREWFSNLVDAQGIRSRAAALTWAILDRTADDDRWLSLCSRTARPVLGAAAGRPPRELTIVDWDPDALIRARRIADHMRIGGVRTVRTSVLHRDGIESGRPRRVIGGDYGIVEAIGVLQYLPDDDRPGEAGSRVPVGRTAAGAVSFLRNAYELVRPGGHLIVSNMLDSHPQLGFTLNVLQWPQVRPRSVVGTTDLFEQAGITSDITVILPDDGVHALYIVAKPEA